MRAIIASAGVRRSGSCILREVTSAAPQLGSEDQKRSRRRGGGNSAAASNDCLVLWNKAALFAAPTPKLVAAGLRSFPIRPGSREWAGACRKPAIQGSGFRPFEGRSGLPAVRGEFHFATIVAGRACYLQCAEFARAKPGRARCAKLMRCWREGPHAQQSGAFCKAAFGLPEGRCTQLYGPQRSL